MCWYPRTQRSIWSHSNYLGTFVDPSRCPRSGTSRWKPSYQPSGNVDTREPENFCVLSWRIISLVPLRRNQTRRDLSLRNTTSDDSPHFSISGVDRLAGRSLSLYPLVECVNEDTMFAKQCVQDLQGLALWPDLRWYLLLVMYVCLCHSWGSAQWTGSTMWKQAWQLFPARWSGINPNHTGHSESVLGDVQ